jgi:flagellar biosynthesis/type III secretory pathway chaperone
MAQQTKKVLGHTLIDKLVDDDNLASMTTPDQHELDAAWELCIDALQAIRQYTFDPGDFEAASVAVLCKAIELTAKKEVQICYKQNGSTSNN